MKVIEVRTGHVILVEIIPAELSDLKSGNFHFDWFQEVNHLVYKLQVVKTKEILGLLSLEVFYKERFIKIRLLAVSQDNKGKNKKFDDVAGNLIAFASKLAVYNFAEDACVVIRPKTLVSKHYQEKYKMKQQGRLLSLEVPEILEVINRFDHDN
ncbi:MAG: N-acetyltransferase [Cytophagales bacterium]|nr:N-acetyltransferase [Cytophagales bacterium]